jgi:pimeloyl-ACP methyl ester carboxylesterase
VPRIAPIVVALAVAVAVTGVGATSGAADSTSSTAPAPAVAWNACGHGFQCGTLTVPVDYAAPDGAQVGIAVTRTRALDPDQRIGSLVFNFGGPGDDGTATLRGFVADLPRTVRERFDLVSFDPRGTGNSRPIDCVSDKATDKILATDPTPDSDAALRSFYDGTQGGVDFVQRCIQKYGSWLAHLGSRDVARDLDRLRQAMHEDALNFLGYSYGTVIGAVYAQEFPTHVGHMVLDGPIDFSAGTAGDVDEETASFEHALDAFLRQCASDTRCTFHAHGDPRAALEKLRDRFEAGLTLPVYEADGQRAVRRAGVAAFYTAVVSSLYDEQFGWKDLADALDAASRGDGTLLQSLADSYNGRREDGTYDSIAESSGLILCADSPDPLESFDSFVSEYRTAVRQFTFLGGFSNDVPIGCDPRLPKPAADEVLGDVRVTGTAPILVVGTTGDPATPYVGATDLVGRIDGSGLLTFVSTEHTAYTKNGCIDRAVDGYLFTGSLPRAGTRCRR